MIITEAVLQAIKTQKGGYSPRDILLLGTSMSTGWRERLLGKDVDENVIHKIVASHSKIKRTSNKNGSCKKEVTEKDISKDFATEKFIKDYIHNDLEISPYKYGFEFTTMKFAYVDWNKIRIVLSQLPYRAFLQTNYWKIISSYLKYKNGGHCNRCPSETHLNVHHITYDHHGMELFFLDDLEVLCEKCHRKA